MEEFVNEMLPTESNSGLLLSTLFQCLKIAYGCKHESQSKHQLITAVTKKFGNKIVGKWYGNRYIKVLFVNSSKFNKFNSELFGNPNTNISSTYIVFSLSQKK